MRLINNLKNKRGTMAENLQTMKFSWKGKEKEILLL